MKKKSILINLIYNSIYTALNILFPIITLPYISRILKADGIGKVNYAINIVAWFLVFASLGIPKYGVREISKVKDNEKLLSKVFSELFIINFLLTIICSIIYLISINNIVYMSNNRSLFMVVGFQLILNIFNVDWLYQGIEEFGYITKRSILIKTISLIAIFLFVKDEKDYIYYALILSLATVGNNVFNTIHLKKHITFCFYSLELKRHFLPLCFLSSAQLAVSLYALLDTTILGFLCGDSIIGYYTNSQKIIKSIASMCATLGTVLLPRLVAMFSEKNIAGIEKIAEQTVKVILWICTPICVGLAILSEDIVLLLFGRDFIECIDTVRLFSPYILITTLGNLFGVQLLMTFGEEKKLLLSVIVGAFVSLCVNIIFIPQYQQNGAVLASISAELVVMLIQIINCKKYIKIHLSYYYLLKIVTQIILMALVVFTVSNFIENSLLSLAFSILLGGVVYIVSGIFLRNSTQIFFYKVCKTKLLEKRKNHAD